MESIITKNVTPTDPEQGAGPMHSVEALLQLAGIHGQQRLHSKIGGIVRVKGIATKIKPYNKFCYLTLSDRDCSISVKYGADQVITENQPIVVEGVLFLKPSNFITGLECYIDGSVVGSWRPAQLAASSMPPLPNKKRYVSLGDFISENGVENLLVVGTDTAIGDVLSHIDSETSLEMQKAVVRVWKKEILLRELKDVVTETVGALALVRGGDDRTMGVWDDPEVVAELIKLERPFYTALGHSHSSTMADRYADGAFHTPTALGLAINSIAKRERQVQVLSSQNYRLERANAELTQQLNLVRQHQSAQPTVNRVPWKVLAVVLSIVVIVLLLT